MLRKGSSLKRKMNKRKKFLIKPRIKHLKKRRIAICIFDDVAEQCREAAVKYYDTFLPFLLEACNDDNPDVRQAAVYGLGVCSEFGGTVIKPLIGEALSRLNVVIQHPNAVQPENLMAYDNAVSALGKICQFHRDSIDAAQVIPAWLNCLPIKGDLIEAKVVHDQLCSMVERSDRELLGPNNQYLSKIVAVFAEVLCAGKDLATEQTASRMINLLRQLQQTLPPATLASTWSSLTTPATACTAIYPLLVVCWPCSVHIAAFGYTVPFLCVSCICHQFFSIRWYPSVIFA
ncbi:hypothetical protein GBA52_021762 [Prunus armeniaca]|nr:hypothetical protein GBA52_021762 [Prunus armeniaca]